MGYLNTEKPPEKWSSAWFRMFVERLKLAVNDIDLNNFPTGINGSLINKSTLAFDSIGDSYFLEKLRRLNGIEIQHVFFAVAEPYTINTITLSNVGGYVYLDDILLDSEHIKLYFEVTAASSDNTSTATIELHGVDGKLAEVSTNKGQIEWLRSETFITPTVSQTLLVKAKTSNASKPAGLLSAKLIIKIGG